MTGVQPTDKKKKADDELEKVINELRAIDKDLNIRLDNIKKMLKIKRLIIQLFDRYTLEVFETQIKSYKIVFEEISTTIAEGKKEDKSSSGIISRLAKINLDVEYKDKKAQIERSNTLEKLHLSTGKMAKELEATIANCRNNTLDDHNRELSSQLTTSLDKNKKLDEENKTIQEEKAELMMQIKSKDKQIQAQDRQIQKLETENTEVKEQFQLVLQRLDKFERILAAVVGQNQTSGLNQSNANMLSPSSSLSDSDIEVIDMPNTKYS